MENLEYRYARWINSQIGGLKRFPQCYVNVDFLIELYKERYKREDEKFCDRTFKKVYEKILKAIKIKGGYER